jgi:hypothetical protein
MTAIRIIAAALLALAVAGCGDDDDRPDPHATDLAQQVAASSPLNARAKVQVHEAKKKEYTFNILYLNFPMNGQADATDLIRAMIRKLLADGQQPHDQEINIWVWGHIMEPGIVGESGHRTEAYERSIFSANYYHLYDSIEYEDCSPDVRHWRWGHCS